MFKQIPIAIRLLILLFLINTIFMVASFSRSNNPDNSKGEKIFKANCSGCHLNGQNLIKANKPVIGSAKLQSKIGFKEFLESPPRPMPKFENITSMEIQFNSLYNYVNTLMGK